MKMLEKDEWMTTEYRASSGYGSSPERVQIQASLYLPLPLQGGSYTPWCARGILSLYFSSVLPHVGSSVVTVDSPA